MERPPCQVHSARRVRRGGQEDEGEGQGDQGEGQGHGEQEKEDKKEGVALIPTSPPSLARYSCMSVHLSSTCACVPDCVYNYQPIILYLMSIEIQ